jgi:hypothetical protein
VVSEALAVKGVAGIRRATEGTSVPQRLVGQLPRRPNFQSSSLQPHSVHSLKRSAKRHIDGCRVAQVFRFWILCPSGPLNGRLFNTQYRCNSCLARPRTWFASFQTLIKGVPSQADALQARLARDSDVEDHDPHWYLLAFSISHGCHLVSTKWQNVPDFVLHKLCFPM